MNPLAAMWARREHERQQRAELVRLARELRESQIALAPLLAAANARRRANERQDGPSGFVMVPKEYR